MPHHMDFSTAVTCSQLFWRANSPRAIHPTRVSGPNHDSTFAVSIMHLGCRRKFYPSSLEEFKTAVERNGSPISIRYLYPSRADFRDRVASLPAEPCRNTSSNVNPSAYITADTDALIPTSKYRSSFTSSRNGEASSSRALQ